MDTATVAVIIAGLALGVNVFLQLFGGGWKLNSKLTGMEASLRKTITETKVEIEGRVERVSREAGESVAAVRQKIHEVEIWSRDTFSRRESLYKVKDDLAADIKALGDRVEAATGKLEDKIDKLASKP